MIENKRWLCATYQKILSEKEAPCTNSEHSLALNVNNRNPLDKNIYTLLVLMYYLSSFQTLAPAPIKLIESSSLITLCFPLCIHVSTQYKHKSAHTSNQERFFYLDNVLLHIVVLTQFGSSTIYADYIYTEWKSIMEDLDFCLDSILRLGDVRE